MMAAKAECGKEAKGASAVSAEGRKGTVSVGEGEDDNNNMGQLLFQFEGNKLTLDDFIKEWNLRIGRRSAFFEKNTKSVQYDEFEKRVKGKKLDSSLKKCTAFVRKMRQFHESAKGGLETDVRSLNLTKYISEIAGVVRELRVKVTDIPSLVAVCSEIHLRYRDFSEQLLEQFECSLDVNNFTSNPKLSSDLRLFSELLQAGIFPQAAGVSSLLKIIQNLTSLDKDCSQLVPVLTFFLRDFTDELIGGIPRDVKVALEEHVCESQLFHATDLVLAAEDKRKLKLILKKYFQQAKTIFTKKNDRILGCAKYLRKLMETKGVIPPEREKFHIEEVSDLEKFHGCIAKLANQLDTATPKLRHLSINPDEEFEKALLAGEGGLDGGEEGSALFEDEETRQFYQELPDLSTYLFEKKNNLLRTGSTSSTAVESSKDLNESHSSAEDTDSENDSMDDDKSISSADLEDLESDSEDSSDSEDGDGFDIDAERAELMLEIDENSPDLDGDVLPSVREGIDRDAGLEDGLPEDSVAVSATRTSKWNFRAYLSNLKNCVNKTMIDQAAFDFVDNFRSKKCKKDLATHLFLLPRQRMDLLRLCSRLAATLSKVHPEIGEEICDLLRKDFRFLVLKRDQHRLEAKLKITRYIGELTIFSVFPKSEAFNCFKMLLKNFTHHQVEMTCCFVETCGSYLYKSRDTHRRMKLYLDEMLRRKTTQFLEPRYAYQVDCAYNVVCPPSNTGIPKKVKTPLHAFMEYVLCFDLNRNTLERANKALRMFDWNDPTKRQMVIGILSSPWHLNTSQLETGAALLASLKHCRPTVVQAVIENISEIVRLGCEFDSEDMNNIRMCTCQYVAHLFNYKCITTTSLLNVMYYLISYGVTYNNASSRMDPPDSLYRVRLVCHMLRIVGDFVSTPRSNKRLDFFLQYFQRYFLYKRSHPIWEEKAGRKRFPHYVEEMFEDTIKRVRDKWKFRKTVEEAELDILELDRKLREKVKSEQVKRAISGERLVGLKVTVVKEPVKRVEAKETVSYVKQPSSSLTSVAGNAKDLQVVKEEEEDVESELDDEDEFERELRALCSGASDPAINRQKKQDFPAARVGKDIGSGKEALQFGMDKVKVTVLTKQNNKPLQKTVEIGTKEQFLESIKQREAQEQRDKLDVKSKTLLLSKRQQEEEQAAKDRSMMKALNQLGKVTVTSGPVVKGANKKAGGNQQHQHYRSKK